jgi:hypothetical protein
MRLRFLPLPHLQRAVRAAGALSLSLVLACDSNPFDASQVPAITITPLVALPIVQFSWTPQGAQLIRVYKGAFAGDGYGPDLVWSMSSTGPNTLSSPIEYGTTSAPGAMLDIPAIALVPGQPYTVQIIRRDPKSNGSDGFTNNGNRYVATQSFRIGAQPAP